MTVEVSQRPFEDFVPADSLAALGGEVVGDMLHHVALKFLLGRAVAVGPEAEGAYFGLAFGALLPPCLGTFVAADVNIF